METTDEPPETKWPKNGAKKPNRRFSKTRTEVDKRYDICLQSDRQKNRFV